MRNARGSCWTQLGLEVEAHVVPQALVEAAGMKSATNLIVRHRFGDGPVIALNAHGDVVPPGLGWRVDPYGAAVEDGRHGPVMYGRGVAVSKSDFATYTWTLLALEAAAAQGSELAGTLELHFTYDEEAGGIVGPKWLLDAGLTRPDAAIAAGFSYAVVTAHNGCLHLEVTVTGKQAHAAMPQTGVGRPGSGERDSHRALCASRRPRAHTLAQPGHRFADAERGADQGRHQHQCGARPGRVPDRSPHHPGREPFAGGIRVARADCGVREVSCRKSRSTSPACFWPRR